MIGDADCPGCANYRGELNWIIPAYHAALDRLGAVRRLQGSLAASPWETERCVAGILEDILNAEGEAARGLPGPGWIEDLRPVVKFPGTVAP